MAEINRVSTMSAKASQRRSAVETRLALVTRERGRILAPAVFICLGTYVAAFKSLGIAPPLGVYFFDVAILAVLGALSAAIALSRIPLRWAHAASAAVLWCPLVATVAPLWATHDAIYATLFVMQIASGGVILDTRWLVGSVVVVNAIALPPLVAIDGPYAPVVVSCALTASLFAVLIHLLMRRALVSSELLRLELAASEESFRTLLETSPDAMFVYSDANDTHEIRWVNASMLRLLGYSLPDELVGKRSTDTFVHADDCARLVERRALVHRGEVPPGIDIRWARRDGTTCHVHASSRRVTFAGESAWLVVARDMTDQLARESERVVAETTIRRSEERYRLLFDGSPLPIAVFDAETFRFIAVNDKMVESYGYSREELLAMTLKDLKPAEDLPILVREIGAARLGEYRRVGVVRHRHKNGALLEVDITAHHLEIDGRHCVLSIGLDVTSSRRVEEQLRQAQRMDAVGQLAGGVAHDFNNILAVVLSNASLIAQEIGRDDPLRPGVLEIEDAANRAAGLTRQLLAFSRKQPRKVTNLALNSVITNLGKMLSRIVGEDIQMSTSLARELSTIQADVGQVEQVLMNLVVNARDAMPEGGRLAIETADVELDDTRAAEIGVRPGRHVMMAVTDTGCGMTAETQARIFEPFFTTKPVGKGTGLGLATVFGIVKQSEGGIAVSSELGRGTTFRIYLPRVDAPAAEIVCEPERATPRGGSETVLVVEDDRILRSVFRRQLQSFGYRVLEASDPEHALEIAGAFPEPIHLLLTDLVMPGMDGRTLSAQLLAIRSTTKVLYMSGYTEHAAVKSAAIDSRDRLIEKPFTAIALSHAIRETLEQPAA